MFFTIMLKAKSSKEVTEKLLKYINNLSLKSSNPHFIEKDVKQQMEENYNNYLEECKKDEYFPEEQILPFPQYLSDHEGFVLLKEGDSIPVQKWRYAVIKAEDNTVLKIVNYYNPNGLIDYYSFIPPWPAFYIKPYNGGVFSLGLEFEDSMDYSFAEREGYFLDFTINSQSIDFKRLENYTNNKYAKIYQDLKNILSGKPYLSKKQIATSLKIPTDKTPDSEQIERIHDLYCQQEFVLLVRKYMFKNQDANGIQDSEIYENPGIILLERDVFLKYKYEKCFMTTGIIENNVLIHVKDGFFERYDINENIKWAKRCFDFVKTSTKEENIYLLKCSKS